MVCQFCSQSRLEAVVPQGNSFTASRRNYERSRGEKVAFFWEKPLIFRSRRGAKWDILGQNGTFSGQNGTFFGQNGTVLGQNGTSGGQFEGSVASVWGLIDRVV